MSLLTKPNICLGVAKEVSGIFLQAQLHFSRIDFYQNCIDLIPTVRFQYENVIPPILYIFIEVLVNQITEMTRFILNRCYEKCSPISPFQDPSHNAVVKELLYTLMRCNLSKLELATQINQLMPAAQFLVRTFGLKLGHVSLPSPLLRDIQKEKDRGGWSHFSRTAWRVNRSAMGE